MRLATPPARSGPFWGLVLLAVVIGGLVTAYWFAHNGVIANATELPYDQFSRKLDGGRIYKDDKHPLDLLIEDGSSVQTLAGFYCDLLPAKDHLDRLQPFRTTISLDYDKDLTAQLKRQSLTPNIRHKSNAFTATLLNFLPIVLFLVIFGGLVRLLIVLVFGARRLPTILPPR